MTRLTLTATTAACFFAAYHGYAHWIGALTAMEAPPPALPAPVDAPVQPEIIRTSAEQALRQLPGQDWVRTAKFAFQRADDVVLFTQNVDILDDAAGNRVQFRPLVIVWNDRRNADQPPYVIWCETARVQFEQPFRLQFGAGSPGRLVAAAFDGRVMISGPDGLKLQGQDFRFAEEFADRSPHLYSDQHVTFECGPRKDEIGQVRGEADGLQIDLVPSDGIGNGDMPRVDGIDRIRLRQNVRLEFTFEERSDDSARRRDVSRSNDNGPRIGHATITCDGSLEYRVSERIATLENNVLVEHPTPPLGGRPQADRLQCDTLALLFEEELRESAAAATPILRALQTQPATEGAASATASNDRSEDDFNPLPRLRLKQIAATGRRAALQSDRQQLIANMHTLRYDAATREVALLDSESVRVQRQGTKLMSPEVRLVHTAPGELETLECRGAGQLEERDERTDELRLRAYWNEQLRIAPDGETGLTLIRADGEARVIQPGRNGISADHLALWLAEDATQRLSAEAAENDRRRDALPPLRFALAEGSVRMAAREFHVETARLQATFEPAAAVGPQRAAQASAASTPGDAAMRRPDRPKQQWIAQANEVHVRLRQSPDPDNPRQTVTEVLEATATGDVLLLQSAAEGTADPRRPPEPPVSISGAHVHVSNSGPDRQVVTLSGSPAHVRRGADHLEGKEIRLDRAANLVQVIGPGLLQTPVPESISGQLLQPEERKAAEKPQPGVDDGAPPAEGTVLLDVHWQEGMTFDGSEARFLKNVALKLDESRLYCEEMRVRLSRPMSFAEEPSDDEPPQIGQVTCQYGVRLEIYSWEGSRLTGIRKAELAELVLDAETGDLRGLGPGTINDWARGTSRRVSLTPAATARANQPADSDGREWEYTNVRFSEKLTGNTRERLAQLHGRVRLLYAPVEHALETFARDDFSSDKPSAANAVWLGCDTLSLRLYPWPDRDGSYALVGARGQCELEGQRFRAVADMLSYNESQKMFTLKGESPREAIIYYRERPGTEPRAHPAQVLEFVPSENKIRVQGSSGFSGGP